MCSPISRGVGVILVLAAIGLLAACSNPLGGGMDQSGSESLAISAPVFGPTVPVVGEDLKITFYQDISAATLTSSNVQLVRRATGEVLECRISYANRVATISPVYSTIADASEGHDIITTGLKPATAYTLTLNTGIQDLAGAPAILPAAWSFTTNDLDLGLYFYGADGEFQKYVPGQNNRFYDPAKKVYIFFHGWQIGDIAADYHREVAFWQNTKYAPNTNELPLLINAGYNVAAYAWGQFADEAEVEDAEAKVWKGANDYTGLDGNKVNMRYKLSDGTIRQYSTAQSVGDLAYATISQALTGNTSGYIRLAGHSLGNQLATVVAGRLADAGFAVKRLALLDPYWSMYSKSYLSYQWTGAACQTYVSDLISVHGTVVEQFKTSALGGAIGDENLDMRKIVSFVRIWPDFIPTSDQTSQHVYAYQWYHQSFAKAVSGGGNVTLGAAASDDMVRSTMNWGISSPSYWYSSDGQSTATPTDDTFIQADGVSTW